MKKYLESPILAITLGLAVLLLFVGGVHLWTGLMIGLIEALGFLFLVRKSPDWVKRLIHSHPFASDLTLSLAATVGLAQVFGHGLTLGMSGLSCALVLSWSLPKVSKTYRAFKTQTT